MRLIGTDVVRSPRDPDFIRLNATIGMDRTGKELHYWFDMLPEMREAISPSGNGWLTLMLPIACVHGEDITIDRPVDRELVDNLNGIQMLWQTWYPAIRQAKIHAEGGIVTRSTEACENKTISCFSGGVDSLFTYFRHDMEFTGAAEPAIHDLLNVGGFNTTLEDFDEMRGGLGPVAEKFGCRFVPILTNVRYSNQTIETAYSIEHWMEYLSHGGLLASVVHILGLRYDRLIIPASHDFGCLIPWGSHPLSDPLYSSSDLAVVHDSCSFTRVDKTALIAEFSSALGALHVCWQDRRHGNCSKCPKCMRTMATLDLLGARQQSHSFDWSNFSMETLGHVFLKDDNGLDFFLEIAARARQAGRLDIAAAADASMRYSKRKQKALGLVNSNPISRSAWQMVRPLRDAILSNRRHDSAA